MNQPPPVGITTKMITKRVNGVKVTKSQHVALRKEPGKLAPEMPTAFDMAKNFAGSMAKWAKAGFTTVEKSEYENRIGICQGCEFWDGSARGGLGKCNHKQCGCSRLKHWLATEKCPIGKW